jgi:hypothetical protein
VQVRLITDLFQVLLPGIQQDYPHRPLQLTMVATSQPNISFVEGAGASLVATYNTSVAVVLDGSNRRGSPAGVLFPEVSEQAEGAASAARSYIAASDFNDGKSDRLVEVAVLEAKVAIVADVGYTSTTVSKLDITYSTVHSKYQTDPRNWERTIEYVVGELKNQVGLKALYETFVTHKVTMRVHPEAVKSAYLPGWYKLSADIRVDV